MWYVLQKFKFPWYSFQKFTRFMDGQKSFSSPDYTKWNFCLKELGIIASMRVLYFV